MTQQIHFLPPIRDNEFLPPISRWTQIGGLVIVGIMGIGMTLSAVTHYKMTVKAQATIRPAGELRLVQAATEGAVMQVLVKENQLVERGEAIATINDARIFYYLEVPLQKSDHTIKSGCKCKLTGDRYLN